MNKCYVVAVFQVAGLEERKLDAILFPQLQPLLLKSKACPTFFFFFFRFFELRYFLCQAEEAGEVHAGQGRRHDVDRHQASFSQSL